MWKNQLGEFFALTTAEIAVALRITADPNIAPAEPLLSILHRQLQTAVSLVDDYAPAAPEHVRDEAAIRLTGYLYEMAPTGNVSQSPIRHSGALPLLSPYRVLTPLTLGIRPLLRWPCPETLASTPRIPSTRRHSLSGTPAGAMIGTISQAELDAATQFDSAILMSTEPGQ